MSRWTTFTSEDLKAAGHGAIVDRARTLAVGGTDPVAEAITGATARVRRAVAPGNALDADPARIPNSLREVALRMALFALMERIGLPLSDDQKETRRADLADLGRLAEQRVRVEVPDTAEDTPSVAGAGRTVGTVNPPRRQTGRGKTSGL